MPQTPAWQLPLRWLVEDGTAVAVGARVAEFDNGKIAGDLDQRRATAQEAEASLRQARAEAAGQLEQARFELATARGRLAEARLAADVPAEILAAREHDDRQLARAPRRGRGGQGRGGARAA